MTKINECMYPFSKLTDLGTKISPAKKKKVQSTINFSPTKALSASYSASTSSSISSGEI